LVEAIERFGQKTYRIRCFIITQTGLYRARPVRTWGYHRRSSRNLVALSIAMCWPGYRERSESDDVNRGPSSKDRGVFPI
jgi:hypothetical protein